jgi:hypothetical protein
VQAQVSVQVSVQASVQASARVSEQALARVSEQALAQAWVQVSEQAQVLVRLQPQFRRCPHRMPVPSGLRRMPSLQTGGACAAWIPVLAQQRTDRLPRPAAAHWTCS